MRLVDDILVPTNGKACKGDIELITKIVNMLGDNPIVVQLGAGENFTIPLFKERPNAMLYSVDIDEESFNWEWKAMEDFGLADCYRDIGLKDSVDAANKYKGTAIDLLIIDADHSYEGVLADLKAWQKHMNKDLHYIFCHDYDADTAPYYYEGVEKACKEFFNKRFSWRMGWSAAWKVKA